MPKPRSPNRQKAFEMYKANNGNIQLIDIAKALKESDSTVRAWKTKDKWTEQMNGALPTKDTERSVKNKEKSKSSQKKSSSLYTEKSNVPIVIKNTNKETNTIKEKSKSWRFGNKNAVGNKGGTGAPYGNKNALTTGEYETILSTDIFSPSELAIFNVNVDIYKELEKEYKLWLIREHRMFERIKELKEVKGGMIISSITTQKSDEDGDEEDLDEVVISTVMKNAGEELMKVEEALTRVQAGILKVIEKMHKFNLDFERLEIEDERLKIYRYKMEGRLLDVDECINDEFADETEDFDEYDDLE